MDELLSQLTLEELFQLYYRLKDAAKRLYAAYEKCRRAHGPRRIEQAALNCADETARIELAVWREAILRQSQYRKA